MEEQTVQYTLDREDLVLADTGAAILVTRPEGEIVLRGGELLRPDRVLVQLADTAAGDGEPDPGQWPGESGQVTAWTSPARNTPAGEVTLRARNIRLAGDLYNGTGYRDHAPTRLSVVLGGGASLEGVISATQVRFGASGIENQAFSNGGNEVSVRLEDGACWLVQGAGYLTSLTVGKGCRFRGMALLDDRMLSIQKGRTYEGLLLVLPE